MANQTGSIRFSERVRKIFDDNQNVLVVEDDKIMGQMVAEILDDLGFRVITAGSGMGAFEKLRQNPVDFIVLDILLPEIDGFEFYAELQSNPDTRGIPVMIISAWSHEKNVKRASEMGIQHFLPKPFTEDELVHTILTLLIDDSRETN
jgi:chemosensory pili system protein ChpA (sensor histidine kinase/response regulator)